MHRWFNPKRFSSFFLRIMPIVYALGLLSFSVGVYQALWVSPVDYQQGEAVRLMYVHVPAAWMALLCYGALCAVSAARLIWKNPFADVLGQAIAPVGALFTALCLITGSLWGKPMWGAWWVWDARLTSMLILFFQYGAYLILIRSIENVSLRGSIAAVFALLGGINLPIIKFSVEWWNTLHQPASLLRRGGVAIDGSMLLPLLLMFLAFLCYFLAILHLRVQVLLREKKMPRAVRH